MLNVLHVNQVHCHAAIVNSYPKAFVYDYFDTFVRGAFSLHVLATRLDRLRYIPFSAC